MAEETINPGPTFPDYIPAEEEHLYPGMGMGNRLQDWVPEGTTAPEMERAKERLAEQHAKLKQDRERLEAYRKSEAAKRPR